MENPMRVQVLCVDTTQLDKPKEVAEVIPQQLSSIEDNAFAFISRSVVDSNDPMDQLIQTRFRQVIPYALVKYGDKYLSYQRKGSEERLHSFRSLGIGGHIDITDYTGSIQETISKSANREVMEELGLNTEMLDLSPCKQLIIDNTSTVSKAHVGIPYIMDVSGMDFNLGEELHLPVWLTKEEILELKDQYEIWSRLLINSLI